MREDRAPTGKRISNILRKEWKNTFSNLNSALFLTILPLLITAQALVMISVSFATFSIIEEKQERTLEPLLATPLRTWELLLGKALAGVIPSLIISWLCVALSLLAITQTGSGGLLRFVLNHQWFISLFLLVPLLSLLALMLRVIASLGANDPRTAQNVAIVLLLPIMGIVGLQLTGVKVFTASELLLFVAGIEALNLLLLHLGVRLFQRERILTRWMRS